MKNSIDPDGRRLPIKIDSTSNGEFMPEPLSRFHQKSNDLAHDWASGNAKSLGQSRRRFLISSCGAASTLLAFNHANASIGATGGYYDVAADAARDPELAAAAVEGDEFIFDIQNHHVNPDGGWRPGEAMLGKIMDMPNVGCEARAWQDEYGYLKCFSAQNYVKDMFLDSDTDLAVLSLVPAPPGREPLTLDDAVATRELVDSLKGSKRMLMHSPVVPNFEGSIETMAERAREYDISAWKTYTQFGPGGKGYWLDDPDSGIPFIEEARRLGIKLICIHKGMPLSMSKTSIDYIRCRDMGVVARRYPDVNFIAYHAGYRKDHTEGPFKERHWASQNGTDSLIQAMIDNGIPRNGNIYAEIGSTWRYLMRYPLGAAHTIGKLLKYVGEDNVLWGTDSIWYGSPQDQIQAFRAFQIAEPLREKYGYPELTPRLKAKIFGLNAAVPYNISAEEVRRRARTDKVGRARAAYIEDRDPHFMTYGPKNRREFLRFTKLTGGWAG